MTRYEPDELPGCSTPQNYYIGVASGGQISDEHLGGGRANKIAKSEYKNPGADLSG